MSKAEIREQIWKELAWVAKPDPRFKFDFGSFIPDFEGSGEAIARLRTHKVFQKARSVFVTPDNCLKTLPKQIISEGKTALVASGGLRRGFYLLEPEARTAEKNLNRRFIDKDWQLASLEQIRSGGRIELLVTGASVINKSGVRYGKGHGYFDLEWAILWEIGIVDSTTPIAAVVHDCQVIDAKLEQEVFDAVCDLIFTPTQVIEVLNLRKPTTGVIWDKLEAGILKSIPPLEELKKSKDGSR